MSNLVGTAFPLAAVLPMAVETDPIAWIVNYGVAGIVIALLVTGRLRTKSEVDGLKEQIEAQAKVIEAFQTQLSGSTLPALERSAQVMERIPKTERVHERELRLLAQEISILAGQLQAKEEED